MILAGLQNLSLVDYPGCLAAVVFTQGCNFCCPYCQNPDLVTCEKKFDLSEKNIFDFLKERRNMLEGVVITGGEPVIHKDLENFVKKIKDLELKVKLDTNGSNPHLIEDLIEKDLVDYLAVDIKTSMAKYGLVTGEKDIARKISSTIRLAMSSGVPYEFRTTCVPGIVSREDFKEIAKLVSGAEKYCLQQFRAQVTYDHDFEKTRPFKKEDLESFAGILAKNVKKIEIRGV